jgi:dissimilatory sulfite reductase related protein
MPVREYRGCAVDVNDEGFLLDASQWTPEIAQEIAVELGVALTERHWSVITFCREDAALEGQPPPLRRITKLGGVGMKEMYDLFPKAPAKLAAKIAGLPKPKGCV